jgi:two-component system, NarL family, nitrate/nitrite response regulator NarL
VAMLAEDRRVLSGGLTTIRVMVVSEVRFLRECLADILARRSEFRVCDQSASLADALVAAQTLQPDIVLLDGAVPGGFGTVAKFRSLAPPTSIVALAIAETEESVLAWADAGVAGYVPNSASVDELVSLLGQTRRGEQTCPARISGCLIRRIAAARSVAKADAPSAPLTRRESEIFRGAARQSPIGPRTTARRFRSIFDPQADSLR